MKSTSTLTKYFFSRIVAVTCGILIGMQSALATLSLPDSPLFVSLVTEPPLVLLTMGRDHKLFYEAYNDVSDLDQDGNLDVGYKPTEIDYFGYFDSFKCYNYDSSSTDVFRPVYTTSDKTCPNSSAEWSGDFLNFVTTSRIDALRKVLYGGYRSLDTASDTYIERSHIPQDAHSWGKEYNGLVEGYDIRDYTPLDIPNTGKRHLFANTSINTSSDDDVYEPPLMRVLTNSGFRVWDWLSIERPVADSQCGIPKSNCVPSSGGSSKFSIIPNSATDGVQNVFREFYDNTGCAADPNCYPAAANESEMDDTEEFAIDPTGTPPNSPFASDITTNVDFPSTDIYSQTNDYFLFITGTLNISTTGTYEFAVDGDDAIDFHIDVNGDFDFTDPGEFIASYYGAHAFDGNPDSPSDGRLNSGSIALSAGSYVFRVRLTEISGGAGVKLYWAPPGSSGTTAITDYEVRTEVCVTGLLEGNCVLYGNGTTYKPTGVLHDFGADNEMMFGLLTGSYEKNLSGGVMRKLMGSFTDEFDPNDGTFTSTVGIVKTIDRLREIGFNTSEVHASNCGGLFNRFLSEGQCRWWGNPIAEMMYEGLRYFAGKQAPTPEFDIAASGNDDADLQLPLPTWDDPYDTTTGGAESCAIPLQLVISDINPSYDSDTLPGANSNFLRGGFSGDISGLNVETIADAITTLEDSSNAAGDDDIVGSHFIGQSGGDFDFSPSPKSVTSLGAIRGLSPEEPSKEGSYYSASIAAYGVQNDIHPTAAGDQNVQMVAVAVASPIPRFEIPVRNSIITLVPYGKSVGNGNNGSPYTVNPMTNSIVDFYIEEIFNTNASNVNPTVNGGLPYYKFRINYEDVEQGNDHDMDAIVEYIVSVDDNVLIGDTSDDILSVTLNSIYAAGFIAQHMGYAVSGTTADGTYLVVRDADTGSTTDPDFDGDTPNVAGVALPLTDSRTFEPGSTTAATLLEDPLWYAAKWGGFIDEPTEADEESLTYVPIPDKESEWDDDGDGVPDSYFLVTNAGRLQDQLRKAFERITELTGASASSVAINSTVLRTTSRLYQATFDTANWEGELTAYTLTDEALLDEVAWTANSVLPTHTARNIYTMIERSGVDTAIEFKQPPTTGDNADLVTALEAGVTGQLVDELTAGNIDGRDIINFIRGDQSQEEQNSGVFRNREVILGDIVNGSPISISIDDFGYDRLGAASASSYPAYLATKASRYTDASDNIFSVVFAPSNGGMLHAFQDTKDTTGLGTAGQEIFAYVPKAVHSTIATVADPFYQHRFFVDATPSSFDAYVDVTGDGNPEWATILSGSLGLGGRAIYALDASDPRSFGSDDVLWEVDNTDYPQIGHITHSTAVVRLNNGDWGLIVGNGYNSDTHTSQLLIFNAETGALIRAIDTGIGNGSVPNGMAQPFVLDQNGDRIADFVYAGDLYGNMWKFDLTSSSEASWGIHHTSSDPLYTAIDGSGTAQPITSRPVLVNHPTTGYVVLFGTGKYLETGDNIISSSPQVNTFYGIHDDGSTTTVGTGRTTLIEQLIESEVDVFFEDDPGTPDDESLVLANRARVVSENTVNYSTNDGWYIDLESPIDVAGSTVYQALGERVIANPLTRFERIIFTTFIPAGSCEDGGDATIMELDAVSGARLENSVFDFNNDGVIDANDFVSATGGTTVPGSGIFIPATLASPAVITANDASQEYKLTSGISGEVSTTLEATGAITIGRQSWRQLK